MSFVLCRIDQKLEWFFLLCKSKRHYRTTGRNDKTRNKLRELQIFAVIDTKCLIKFLCLIWIKTTKIRMINTKTNNKNVIMTFVSHCNITLGESKINNAIDKIISWTCMNQGRPKSLAGDGGGGNCQNVN